MIIRHCKVATLGLAGALVACSRQAPAPAPTPFVFHTVTADDTIPFHFQYDGIAWGTSVARLQDAIPTNGLVFEKVDADGDLSFRGGQNGYDVALLALMSPAGVQKFVMDIATPDSHAIAGYDSVCALLAKQYGPPTEVYRDFRLPYREGDGRELEAIKKSAAKIGSYWLHEVRGHQYGDDISVTISPSLTVDVTYESANWEAEATRRKALQRRGRGGGGGGGGTQQGIPRGAGNLHTLK